MEKPPPLYHIGCTVHYTKDPHSPPNIYSVFQEPEFNEHTGEWEYKIWEKRVTPQQLIIAPEHTLLLQLLLLFQIVSNMPVTMLP